MEIIQGRELEKRELAEALKSKESEFIVVYGRRRVGKTFLITKYFEAQSCKFFNVVGIDHGFVGEQLAEFMKAIGDTFYNGAGLEVPTTWMQAFSELQRAISSLDKKQKVVLFFDEFPWMVTRKSRLLQTLEYYWNRYFVNNERVKLVICGSSASWIIKNILYNKGGLHNRTTRQLLLKPFNLKETRDFLQSRNIHLNDDQVLQLYMAIGGVPHYLKQVKKGISAIQNINNLCFKKTGILFDEFDKLFKSLFRSSEAYVELIKIIALSRYGLARADIGRQAKLSISSGRLTERLSDLEDAGFIKSFLPLGHSKKGVYYRLIDEYSYFYLRWIQPERQTLLTEDIDHGYWCGKANTQSFRSWAGYAFETICYKHIAQIKDALQIKAASEIGTWRHVTKRLDDGEGAQIDLIFDNHDMSTIICEIKYTDKPFAIDKEYYHKLLKKIAIYKKISKTEKTIFLALISAKGIKSTIYSEEIVSHIVVLADLFK